MKKIIIFIILIFSSSFTPIAAKFIVSEVSPLSLAFLRFGIAAVLFNLLFLFKRQNYKIDREDFYKFIWLGALVIPINQFFFLNGVNMSLASHSGVTYACTPLFAYLISIGLKHEKFSIRKLIPILLTIAGIFFVFYDSIMKSKSMGSDILLGDIFLVFAVLSWASYITFSRDIISKYGALKTSTISFNFGIIMYIPIFLYDVPNLTFDNITLPGLLGFLHLSIIVAFAGYFLFTYALKIINVTELTTSTNLSPVVTIVFSWLLLKEQISYYFIIGAFITFIGVFLAQIKGEEETGELIN
ncbi:MAG: DMT family transporter [Candidatus Kapaibacterium sp.]